MLSPGSRSSRPRRDLAAPDSRQMALGPADPERRRITVPGFRLWLLAPWGIPDSAAREAAMATREGIGTLRTTEGKECSASYTMKSWPAEGGQTRTEGALRCTDPDVAFDSFRPGAVASLELGSGEMLEIDITSILAEEIGRAHV